MTQPSVGRIVHYTSHGDPSDDHGTGCRAAMVTVADGELLALAIFDPTGLVFRDRVRFHDPAVPDPGDPRCANRDQHGDPHRYCTCGWIEARMVGGTWHWPERDE